MSEKEAKRNRAEWLKTIVIAMIVAIFVRAFFFSNYVVEGESMMPTLREGNLLMVNKIGYQLSDLQRFDIVVFHANDKEDYVKRVIGLPGDRLEYRNDILYINGSPVEEPYLQPFKNKLIGGNLTGDFTLEEITGKNTVPNGYIFVIGDNRLGSWDSRHFGFVSIDSVVGKVNVRYWPLTEMDFEFK
ncbi:signal peptidase I [Bacillus timonensis]|nr:signal peptidase I [Bacillus timonensis]